jgi:hypothetical protein
LKDEFEEKGNDIMDDLEKVVKDQTKVAMSGVELPDKVEAEDHVAARVNPADTPAAPPIGTLVTPVNAEETPVKVEETPVKVAETPVKVNKTHKKGKKTHKKGTKSNKKTGNSGKERGCRHHWHPRETSYETYIADIHDTGAVFYCERVY